MHRIIFAMSYKSNEQGFISRQDFAPMGTLITETLDGFEPTDRYAVRDLIVTDDGVPQVVERETRTPLTPAVQYREIRDRQPLPDIKIDERLPQHLGISRWFNLKMEAAYVYDVDCVRANRARGIHCVSDSSKMPCERLLPMGRVCTFAKPTETIDAAQARLDCGEFSFFVPREATQRELDKIDEHYWDHIISYGYYRMYSAPYATPFGVTYTTPNFRFMYELRHEELTKSATAYAYDPDMYLAMHGMDPGNLTPRQEDALFELRNIVRLKDKINATWGYGSSDESIGEAVKQYGEDEGAFRSQCMQQEVDVVAEAPTTWRRASRLLTDYIEQIHY